MAAPVRIALLAACAALALLGLALGAESQREAVLESDANEQRQVAESAAAGNLVLVTASLVALGATGGLVLLSTAPVRHRILPALGLYGAIHLGVALGQSMWPSYTALVEFRRAQLANSLLMPNLPGSPSVLIGPVAVLLGCVLVAGWCAARLLRGRAPDDESPRALLAKQAGATLLAAPFLAIAAWGNLRILVALPDDRPGLGPAFVLLPAATLACLALASLAAAKTWQLGTYVRNARLGPAVQDAWLLLGRIEAATVAALGALALAGTFLPSLALDDLTLGHVTFGVKLPGHTQLLILIALVLAPQLAAHRAVARALAHVPGHAPTLEAGPAPRAVAAIVGVGATFALAGLGTWLGALDALQGRLDGALWAWLLAALPAAGVALSLAGAKDSAPSGLLLAFVLWAIGNTVTGDYTGTEGTAVLDFGTPPGVLALWRTLGAVVAAAVFVRLALGLGQGRRSAIPVAAGAGIATATVALLEMPLTAWLSNRSDAEAIAVGSVVASLEPPVRAIVHCVAVVLAVAAALLVALLQRPQWFQRRPPRPVAVIRAKRQAANAPA